MLPKLGLAAEALASASYTSLHAHSFPVVRNSKQESVKMNFFHKAKLVNASLPEIQSMMVQY